MGRASLDKITFTREIAKHSDRSQHSEDGFPRSPPGSHLIWLSCLFQESYNVQYEMTRKKALMLLLSQSKEQEQEEQEVRPHISTLKSQHGCLEIHRHTFTCYYRLSGR